MTNLAQDLAHFTGSEHWYRHPLRRSHTYTDGVKFLADNAGAYWLIDKIIVTAPADPFQVWNLTVNDDRSATLNLTDGDGDVLDVQNIEFTDFPLPEITLWLVDNVLLLPSEY